MSDISAKLDEFISKTNPTKTGGEFYTLEHYKPHKVRLVFKGNVADKSIKTHTQCANLNVHRCIYLLPI